MCEETLIIEFIKITILFIIPKIDISILNKSTVYSIIKDLY